MQWKSTAKPYTWPPASWKALKINYTAYMAQYSSLQKLNSDQNFQFISIGSKNNNPTPINAALTHKRTSWHACKVWDFTIFCNPSLRFDRTKFPTTFPINQSQLCWMERYKSRPLQMPKTHSSFSSSILPCNSDAKFKMQANTSQAYLWNCHNCNAKSPGKLVKLFFNINTCGTAKR